MPLRLVTFVILALLAGCKREPRREAELAAHAVRERMSALERKANPKAWKEKRRRTELTARTRPRFIYQGDTLAIRDVSAKHKTLITGKIDVRGIRQPNGSCKQDDRDQPRVNPTYGLFVEVGQVNFRTCAIQIWVIDPHIPDYGPMSSDTVVRVAPR